MIHYIIITLFLKNELETRNGKKANLEVLFGISYAGPL